MHCCKLEEPLITLILMDVSSGVGVVIYGLVFMHLGVTAERQDSSNRSLAGATWSMAIKGNLPITVNLWLLKSSQVSTSKCSLHVGFGVKYKLVAENSQIVNVFIGTTINLKDL